MSYRTITVASTTKSTPKLIQSEATTWGALKDSLRAEFGDLDKMRAVVRETRNDLTSDDALLPDEAHTILLTPRQIKAGASEVDVRAVLEDVKEYFITSIDEIIYALAQGDYNKATSIASSTKVQVQSSSLQNDLAALKSGNF